MSILLKHISNMPILENSLLSTIKCDIKIANHKMLDRVIGRGYIDRELANIKGGSVHIIMCCFEFRMTKTNF